MSFPGESIHRKASEIDYTSPEYITQNINYECNFQDLNIINEECRNRMIRTSCDQLCFYVFCALKAYELIEEIPSIVVFGGGGVMGTCIVDALVEVGCKPILKMYCRDTASVQKWLQAGIRATLSFEENSKIDILVVASNIMSFPQMCKDIGHCLKSTTFIISTVFGMQRKRLYRLFESPGVVRTFVERKMSRRKKFSSAKLLLYRKDSIVNMFLIVENYMVLLGIEPSVARELLFDIFLGRNNVQQQRHDQQNNLQPLFLRSMNLNEDDEEDSESSQGDNRLHTMSPSHSSSDIFTPLRPMSSRRSSGADCVVEPLSPQQSPSSPSNASLLLPPPSPVSALSSARTSSLLPAISSAPLSQPRTGDTPVPFATKHLLSGIIDALHVAYGVLFAEELSKHVDELKLPSLRAIQTSKCLNPKPRQYSLPRPRRKSLRDNKVKVKQKYFGYLGDKTLLRIFDSDRKSAPDVKTSAFFEHISSLSDGDESDDDLEEELDFDFESSDVSPAVHKYVVKSSASRKTPISRVESDIFVGKNEGKRFNGPSTIKALEEEEEACQLRE